MPDRVAPECNITLYPSIGDSLTVFLFDASGSKDNLTEDLFLKVRWDVESDGYWETDWSISKKFSWRYTRSGIYQVSCEIIDAEGNTGQSSRVVTVRGTYRDSIFTDPRDGKQYKAALIQDRWWMAENLKYGIAVDVDIIPKNDAVTEYYSDPHGLYGAYYLWQEATIGISDTLQGACPPGWRLPRVEDIRELNDLLYFQTSLGKYVLEEGILGLDLSLSGRFIRTAGQWDGQGTKTSFWITNGTRPARFLTWMVYLPGTGTESLRVLYEGDYGTASIEGWSRDWGEFNYSKVALPVRCVRDIK
jgi:uncharacterized protein (TIGR02145 family)